MKLLLIKMHKKTRKRNGFTLIEMLIVLVIVALLMAIIIPNVAGQRDRIEAQGAENITEIVTTQLNTYGIVEGSTDGVTTQMLAADGYLTAKQVEEATRLIDLAPDTPISTIIASD
ncbi:prepilin-type N-terminal cleavage/methylation domain-containing protein [Aerococcaceae bacterium DSM 111176]|nr:prepilin-type N-terminal cleavage/methylation domain-containing protein [Aerococcaceae bacterium DSM 111176]